MIGTSDSHDKCLHLWCIALRVAERSTSNSVCITSSSLGTSQDEIQETDAASVGSQFLAKISSLLVQVSSCLPLGRSLPPAYASSLQLPVVHVRFDEQRTVQPHDFAQDYQTQICASDDLWLEYVGGS